MSRPLAVGVVVAIVYAALAALHVYWAVGGLGLGSAAVIPTDGGRPLGSPSRLATIAVAAALAAASVTVLLRVGLLSGPVPPGWVRAATFVLGAVFILRAIGDFHWVGFFKTVRTTQFAVNDTRFYSPLCVALGLTVLWLASTRIVLPVRPPTS